MEKSGIIYSKDLGKDLFFFFFDPPNLSISLAEPLVLMLKEKADMSRPKASSLIGVTAWILSLASVLSFNQWKTLDLAGKGIFDWITSIATDWMLPIGCLGYAIVLGWALPTSALDQGLKLKRGYALWRFLVRYLAPLAIMLILFFHPS